MKLVIRQYLASLKERKELDALLPDLLSQIGLEVFLKPSVGSRQYGVDVGAFGKLTQNSENKVYLFSVKSGDLGRKDWDSGNLQDLRPSINEIVDVFIPNHIPVEYKNKPIEICLCFGGNIKEDVRQNVTQYTQKQTTENMEFSEWNGDRLAELIEQHMLREELLPENCRGLLRKSLAMIDEPDISFKHFSELIYLLTDMNGMKLKQALASIRQLYLCLWILYAWCREEDNLESVYLSLERAALYAWDSSKPALGKKNKLALEIQETLHAILLLNLQVTQRYLEVKILPHVQVPYALSHAVRSSCTLDVNLKMFDILGRLAIGAIWSSWSQAQVDDDSDKFEYFSKNISRYQAAITSLINNNPILLTPYKDEQAIDIALALFALSSDPYQLDNMHTWLNGITNSIYNQFRLNGQYPSNINSYAELIEHPKYNSEEYRKEVTKGSVLYPYISAVSAIFGFLQPYETVQKIKKEFLPHCNFQVFFFTEESEEHFYKFEKTHGATLSHVCVDELPEKLVEKLSDECKQSNKLNELSAIKYSHWPLILMGCRHYRLPVPMHFFMSMYEQINQAAEDENKSS
ncbi:MAG: hypothetical protein COA42_05220 [Alteromonadaceae bacterium]|nr:MAG: hypothetical protein COA42_05220 [Alteromonadaceae bacterium]